MRSSTPIVVSSLSSTEGHSKEEHKTDHVDTVVGEQCDWMSGYLFLYTSYAQSKKDFNDIRHQSQMSNTPMTCVLSEVCISDLNSNEFIVDCCFGNKGEVVT